MAIKVVIDSSSDISAKEAQELGIHMMPMNITFGDKDYLDGVDLLPNEFFDLLESSKDLPTTSLINSFRFGEEFAKLTANGDQLIVITISSKLSGTYQAAVQASLDYPGKVFVIDSLNATAGERVLAEYAMQLIQKGLPITQIVEELNTAKNRIRVIALVDTLEYLKKGGRISTAAAFAGKLLALKPIIAVIDGEVKMISKAIGLKNTCNLLNKLIEEKGGLNTDMPYCLIWSGNTTTNLDTFIKNNPQISQISSPLPRHTLGGTIGTHIGPGAAGVVFFEK